MRNIIQFVFHTNGRIGRLEFWVFHVASICLLFLIEFVSVLFVSKDVFLDVTFSIFAILYIWGNIAVHTKRFHDLDMSGNFTWLVFLPIANVWAFIICGFTKGTNISNVQNGNNA